MGTAASANANENGRGGTDDEPLIQSDSITNWTANRVGVWLMNTCELGQYCEMFYTARVNGAVLKDLTDEELEELGIHNRMHRKRIFTEICKQNDHELDELERAHGTPSPRQYWKAINSRRSAPNALYASPRSQLQDGSQTFSASKVDTTSRSNGDGVEGSPKFTVGPNGTPRAWTKPTSLPESPLALGGPKPGDVQARTPKRTPYKTVASVNLIEALDTVEGHQKRRHAKWYANKVVEKSLVAMRAALKTARGMAVLQAEARYHGSLEAARETLMHNTRMQARTKAIEDFYSGNWRHKGLSPMHKYANRGFSVEQQVEAAMRDEAEERERQRRSGNDNSSFNGEDDDEHDVVRKSERDLLAAALGAADRDRDSDEDEDEEVGKGEGEGGETTDDASLLSAGSGSPPRHRHTPSMIRRKYAAPEGKRSYHSLYSAGGDGPGPGSGFQLSDEEDPYGYGYGDSSGGAPSPGQLLVKHLMQESEDEDEDDEEERALFESAAKRGLHLKQLITAKKELLSAAKRYGDAEAVKTLTHELAELEETGPPAPAPKPPPRRSSKRDKAQQKDQRATATAVDSNSHGKETSVPISAVGVRTSPTPADAATEPTDRGANAGNRNGNGNVNGNGEALSPVAGSVEFVEERTFKINNEAVENVLSQVEQLGAAGAEAKVKEILHAPLTANLSTASAASTASLYEVPVERFDPKSASLKPPNMSGIWARTAVVTKERGRIFFSTLNRCERALAARGSHLVADMVDLKNFKRTVTSTSGEDPDADTGGVDWAAARHFMVIQQQSHRVTLQQVSKGKLNTLASMMVGDSESVPLVFYNEILHIRSKWLALDRGHDFCSKDKANLIHIPPIPGGAALLMTFKAAMKTGSLKQQKVMSMLVYVEPGPANDAAQDTLHVLYSAVERSSLHLTFKRLPQEQLRPLRKQWKFKARDKYPFLKAMKDCLPRSVDEVEPGTIDKIVEAQKVVRTGLVDLGPTLISVLIPSQAYDVILHDITKHRFDILCDGRTVLDSSEADLKTLNSKTTLAAIRRELQAALPHLPPNRFQDVMDPIFQALNVTRHTQAAFQYLSGIFQDSLQLWCRPVSSTPAVLKNCPAAAEDTELKVLGVAIDQESSTIYVQSKIPFEILLRQWCYPEGSDGHVSADYGWVFFLPLAAIVTEGISFDDGDENVNEQNICVRLQAMD